VALGVTHQLDKLHAAPAAQLDSITSFTSWLQQNHVDEQPRSSDFVVFTISAIVEQRDLLLRPENQPIKPIALLQENSSTTLLY
jgi:hypothetical protein